MREITVYALRADRVREMDPSALERAMPERMKRARRFRLERDRLLCAGAGFLLTGALGIRNEDEIRCGGNGKPFAPGYPAFSLSHSGAWCVLAVCADGEIGADIEEIDGRSPEIAPEVCTAAELDWMRADPVERFFRLWTWKESVMKATGLGLALPPASFEVLPFAEGRPLRLLSRDWHARGGRWDDCAYSVCADGPIGAVRWVEADFSGAVPPRPEGKA